MEYVKMLGLAAMAAMVSMVFAVSSASATILEDANGQLLKGSKIDLSVTGSETGRWEAGSTILDECTGTIESEVTNSGGASATVFAAVAAANFTWTDCNKVTQTLSGGTFEIHWTSGSNGTLTATGFEITINTIFGSCVFGFGSTAKSLGSIQGGTPATVAVNTNVPKRSGTCPSEVTWTATYTVTSPGTLRITSA